LQTAFRIWASLLSLAIIVQLGLAGYGAFHAVDESDDKGTITKHTVGNGFDPHTALGYIILVAAVVLLLIALGARRGGDSSGRVRWSALILGLVVAQVLLAYAGEAVAWLGVLHGMGALAVAGFAGSLAGREWAAYRGVAGRQA
jgi:hypothetical protein